MEQAHPLEPRISRAFAEYAQDRGFLIDPAGVRSKDKPKVERNVQYVRGSFFAGEQFAGLPDAQRRARERCAGRAGQPVHRTTQCRPAELSAAGRRRGYCPRRSWPMTCRRTPPRRCTVITVFSLNLDIR